MSKPGFCLIYNQDCTDLFAVTKEPLMPQHVDRMIDEVADGGVEVMLLNGNAQLTCHPTRVWQTFWDGYTPGDTAFFGPVDPAGIPGRRQWVEQMQRLAAGGCDYLAHGLACCRERGLVPGVSVRMNDTHDYPDRPDSHMFSRFYRRHPECRLENPPALGWGAGDLNYACPDVREYYLAYIRELVSTYDFDVLDLDFLRFDQYFPAGQEAAYREVMTDFLRDVRAITEAAGRPITLMIRIAAVPALAQALGFDIARWAEEGLIDAITVGAFLNTDWHMPVEEYRALVGDAVGLFVSTDFMADRRDERLPQRKLPLEDAMLRGFAASHQAGGADGVYFFNFFCVREEDPPQTPHFVTLRTLFQPNLPHTYLVTAGTSNDLTDMPSVVPVTLAGGESHTFSLLLGAMGETGSADAVLVYEGEGAAWEVSVNGKSVREGKVEPIGDGEGLEQIVIPVPSSVFQSGRNVLTVDNMGEQATILGVEIRVNP
ncbi:MAG: hypothetical protein ACYDBB_21910 [Armatimonadota bacterium]